jgi:hypothetical protein
VLVVDGVGRRRGDGERRTRLAWERAVDCVTCRNERRVGVRGCESGVRTRELAVGGWVRGWRVGVKGKGVSNGSRRRAVVEG